MSEEGHFHTADDMPEDDSSYTMPDTDSLTLRPVPPTPTLNSPTATQGIITAAPPDIGLHTGDAYFLPQDFNRGQHVFTNTDSSMMKLYDTCDKAGAPRYLMDKVISQIKSEMSMNNFNPLNPTIKKRDAFMKQMHRKFPTPNSEPIDVQLESFPEPVTMYRFDFIKQLQFHLLNSELYADIDKLNVHPDHRWDQTKPPPNSHMREIPDGTFYKKVIGMYLVDHDSTTSPDDLEENDPNESEPFAPFVIILEQYQDSTGTDKKEGFSLEPVVMSTLLLQASFTGDHRSRFLIGYIPNFAKEKSSAEQSRRGTTAAGYGSSVRDYHKCLSVLLEPLVNAQANPPLLDVRLGDQIKRVRAIIVMGAVLGDGKSNDMLTGRVAASSGTLRLSRATFTPSVHASDTTTTTSFHWITTRVIERVTRAAMFDPNNPTCPQSARWRQHLQGLITAGSKRKLATLARRRVKMAIEVLKKALGSHRVSNAFFPIEFASEFGIFGHTLADVMHLLEEGLLKYLLSVFLDPLSDSIKGDLDDLVKELLCSNRCYGSRLFPRVNFTRGYSRLTLLSSEERTGALLALVLTLNTHRGMEILRSRFHPEFDQIRKERAGRFQGKSKENDSDDNSDTAELVHEEQSDPESDSNPTDASPIVGRVKVFTPTRSNIIRVVQQIKKHDMGFLLSDVFPEIPTRHIYQCLVVIWETTYRLKDDNPNDVKLPQGYLDIPAFKQPNRRTSHPTKRAFSQTKLLEMFVNYDPDTSESLRDDPQPSITSDANEFIQCCELMLALRSFYIHSGEHCPSAIPYNNDGSFNVELVDAKTRHMAHCLKTAVNRGAGTNQWNIPKMLDLRALPTYMDRFGSTGRFHVGFAERGLKHWAKIPGSTSQKRNRGQFELQCSKRIREDTMMHHALQQMAYDDKHILEDYTNDDNDVPDEDDEVGGAAFRIDIIEDPEYGGRGSRKMVTCVRITSGGRPHGSQIEVPQPILDHFKDNSTIGTSYEYRTEVTINGTRYRAHPNYMGAGPWYDYAVVKFNVANNHASFVSDGDCYPAKLVSFYRAFPEDKSSVAEDDASEEADGMGYFVLAHCGAYQLLNSEIYSRRSLLSRHWLFELKTPSRRPEFQTITPASILRHIFGISESPGFPLVYARGEAVHRFQVLSDMRQDWPLVFMGDSV